MIRGMVFGVFDGLHDGHKNFLSRAAEQCDELIVVLTLPEMVQQLKGRLPARSFETRLADIKSFNANFAVVGGDTMLGEWKVLKDHQPDRIFLGYDQQGIAGELMKLKIPYMILESYNPEQYKSSLLSQ